MRRDDAPAAMSDVARSAVGGDRSRYREVKRVLGATLCLNLAVATGKGVYAWMSGSLAISADAVHSLVDAAANVAGLVLISRAARPPDSRHPYGHRKLEVIAAAVVGLFVAGAAIRFGYSAIEALASHPSPPATSIGGFLILGSTWAVNAFVAVWEGRKARELGSVYLAADAAHTASDVVVTAAVLSSFTAAHLGIRWADPIGALVVIAIIGWAAMHILATNLPVLLDTAALPADRVVSIARSVRGVIGCHRVRSRGPATAVLVDLHILLENETNLRDAHAIAHAVERALRDEFPNVVDVTVHMEPEEVGDEGL
jgi:cation diffusion facilitator family transporter